jgi:hypothetical protein
LEQNNWTPGDLFDVPHDGKQGGLAWHIHGKPVISLIGNVAYLADGRSFIRTSR